MLKLTFGLSVLLINTATLSHAQEERSRVDGFSFPGGIARSDKYPIEELEIEQQQQQQTQRPARPNNPLEPVTPVQNIPPESEFGPIEIDGAVFETNPVDAEGRRPKPRPNNPRPRPRPTGLPNGWTTARTTTVGEITTPSPWYQKCIDNCVKLADWNPLCGTDKQLYSNPSRLACAQQCGKDVKFLNAGQCPTSTTALPSLNYEKFTGLIPGVEEGTRG